MTKPNRRTFISSAAGVAVTPFMTENVMKSATDIKPGDFPVRVIASGNGLESVKLARKMILEGADPLDAVIAGVNLVEDDPKDTSVGYGGLPNEDGIVELDAAVMHGPTHNAGSVASIRNIKNPSKVAKLVMELTDHVLLVGDGALRFAKAMGFEEENLLTDHARKQWLKWKQSLNGNDNWLMPPDHDGKVEKHHGTIHCAGMNTNGDISCVTTTSGLAYKIPGRVGDSPIIGAGLYVDNEIGSCGSTGRGEENLKNLCCSTAVELLRNGMSPVDAGLEILRRVVKHAPKHTLNEDGPPKFGLNFYILTKDGKHAGVSLKSGQRYAIADEDGARLEDCVPLFE